MLKEIGERLKTQDNRITQNPMFCVQERKRDYGYAPHWVGDTVWILDGEETTKGHAGAEEVGYKDRWETVMVAFTEEGCKEYLQLNGHNHHGQIRIYVESFNRCPEMIAIRDALMAERFSGEVKS